MTKTSKIFRLQLLVAVVASCCLILLGLIPHAEGAAEKFPKNYTDFGLGLILPPGSWDSDYTNLNDEWVQQQLKEIAQDRLQTAEHRYFAASAFVRLSWYYGQVGILRNFCQQFPPRKDDYQYRAICIRNSDTEILTIVSQLEQLAEESFEAFPMNNASADIMRYAGDLLNSRGRMHEAIIVYRKLFKFIPPDYPQLIVDAKLNLAFAYGSALNSRKMQQQSAAYYAEIRSWYVANPKLQLHEDRIMWLSYNRAIGQIFLFQDYEEALKDLAYAMPHKRLGLDSLVFSAYSLAQLGRKEEALATLQKIDLSKKTDAKRRAFLGCYLDLTKRLLNNHESVQSCLTLENPQTDVLLDLTRTMSTMHLPPTEENQLWRKFYAYYSQHLLPDIQEALDSVSSSAELEQTRIEGRNKDLQLKNLGLYRNLSLALSGFAVLLVAAVVMALWFWRNSRNHGRIIDLERNRLQDILENIDESIVRIEAGLVLVPEDSSHFRNLVGGVDLQGAPLTQLLDMFDLSDAQKELIRECLNASLGENPLAWELNYLNLPDEVHLNQKSIACFWQPIVRDGFIEAVLLVMHDVTSVADLKKSSQKAREEADLLLQYAREIMSHHPKAAGQFIREFPERLQMIQDFVQGQGDGAAAMRLTHTLKGTARSLGLIPLQEKIHALEDQIRQESFASSLTLIAELRSQIQVYGNAISQLIGGETEANVANVFDIVATLKPALRDLLAKANIPLRGIRVYEEAELQANELQALQTIILHALTNAADHGYILPTRQGKSTASAVFGLELETQGNMRILKIRDQGAGIDYEALKNLAAQKQWQPQANQIWTDFLFRDGVSTVQAVSQTSGRGVGLAAIREALQAWQGQVQLLDNDEGSGSLLIMQWESPAELLSKPGMAS